jgi:hypothetical protein
MCCRFGGSNASDTPWLDSSTPVETPAPQPIPAHLPTPPTSVRNLPHISTPPLSHIPRPSSPRSSSPFAPIPRPASPRHGSYRPASPLSTHSPGPPPSAPTNDGKVQELLQVIQQREITIKSLESEKHALTDAAKDLEALHTGTLTIIIYPSASADVNAITSI